MPNLSQIQSPAAAPTRKLRPMGWLIFGFVCVLWMIAISGQSLWIDEACAAAWWGNQPTLSAWWLTTIQDHNSEAQTPLYLLYIWGFAKVFGLAEWTLRAANLPWLILGFWAWMRTCGEREKFKWGLAVVAATSPFLWYYLNEARPYIMQAGCIFLIAAAARQLYTAPTRFWLAAFCLGTVGLYGSNMLGAFWAGAAVTTTLCVLGWKRIKPLARTHWVIGLTTLSFLAGIGFYYLWTMEHGNRAAGGTMDVKNIGFIFYELFGFEGLGPGRLEIRGGGLGVFLPYVWGLAAYALILIPVALAGAREIIQRVPIRMVLYSILFFGGVFVFLVGVGVFMHFRLLGRHCTPLLVLVVYLLGMGVARLWSSRHGWAKGWVVLFVGLSLVSSLSLRFAPRHTRDNYRDAAAIAKQALQNGKTVWWNADDKGAAYYHLPLATHGAAAASQALLLVNPSREMLRMTPPPDFIIASRPDVYDGSGALAEFVAQAHYRPVTNLMAFTVWESGAK